MMREMYGQLNRPMIKLTSRDRRSGRRAALGARAARRREPERQQRIGSDSTTSVSLEMNVSVLRKNPEITPSTGADDERDAGGGERDDQ